MRRFVAFITYLHFLENWEGEIFFKNIYLSFLISEKISHVFFCLFIVRSFLAILKSFCLCFKPIKSKIRLIGFRCNTVILAVYSSSGNPIKDLKDMWSFYIMKRDSLCWNNIYMFFFLRKWFLDLSVQIHIWYFRF